MSVYGAINSESPQSDIEDPELASPARMYDYYLGGSHNFASDRLAAERLEQQMPGTPAAVRANRFFLDRVVRFVVQQYGITQFLDLGSGIPTAGNVHEIARPLHEDARVVYVDNDPVAHVMAKRILAGDGRTAAIQADLRDSARILNDPQVKSVLDFREPVALLFIAVFHFIPDYPATILNEYLSPLASGSCVAISHAQSDPDPAVQAASDADYYRATGTRIATRDPEQIMPWLDGLIIEPPGIVPVTDWHPDSGHRLSTADIKRVNGVLARKP